MSWTIAYRLALHLLPTGLRRKHGPAMETLYAREVERARARGWTHGAIAGAAGLWDVVGRGAYEQLRPGRAATGAHGDHLPAPTTAGATLGGPSMPQPTTRQLLHRLAVSFAVALVALTAVLLAVYARRQLPELGARGATAATMVQVLLLAVPFTAALTIPMAVLVAVLRELTRLRSHGVRRLVRPVLASAAGVAVLALALTAEVVPRTNARLSTVLSGHASPPSDREMTIGELRAAARRLPSDIAPAERAQAAAGYEVEVQKKLALPAACVILALVGVAIALRVPRGGGVLVLVASGAVFGAYYLMMVTGESLADQRVVSPLVGMWGANALLLAAALLALARRRTAPGPSAGPAVPIHG